MRNSVRAVRAFGVCFFLFCLAIGSALASDIVRGLIVEELASDSPVAKVGLKLGDRIISYDGKLLASPAALTGAEENTFGKKEVLLEVRRGKEILSLRAPLGKLGAQVRPELPPRCGEALSGR